MTTDLTVAMMQMHTLKGVSALLGANSLSETAGALEKACRAKAGPLQLQEQAQLLLPRVAEAMAGLIEAVAMLEAASNDANSGNGHAKAEPVDTEQLIAALIELEGLLSDSNLVALEKFAECEQALSQAVGAAMDPLAEAMQNLEMELALQASRAIRSGLEV